MHFDDETLSQQQRDKIRQERARQRRRLLVSSAIMLAGLAGVFGVGHFGQVFGSKVAFDRPAPFLFMCSVWLGIFGALFAITTAYRAFVATVCIAAGFLALFVLGAISRGAL